MKVLLRAPINSTTGYGNDGIGIARALTRLGIDVSLDPLNVQAPLPGDVAQLLTKRLEAPFDLLIHHVDPAQLGISQQAREAAAVTVAWTMWEFTTLDNCRGRSSLRRRLKDYDLVVGYDSVSSNALQPYVTGKAATVQGGFWAENWPEQRRPWHGDVFNFTMVGALHQRKDPFVAIQAFKELKDEEPHRFDAAHLHLKTVEPGLHRRMEDWAPGLHLHYEMWPDERLRQFYGDMHVLLAPSRGEGKNMPALEFMSTGGTVIATNWGGHQQWLSDQYAYPLRYELAPISGATPNCRNARASVEHLKELMLRVVTQRSEVAAKGTRAAQIIPAMCSWNAVLRRLFQRLADEHPAGGALHREFAQRVDAYENQTTVVMHG